jgi:Protein of unknown function (DUF1488)
VAAYRGEYVTFLLEHETDVEECAVACDALLDLGHAHRADTSPDELVNIFEMHREKIKAAALAKLRVGKYSLGGILVTSSDFDPG